MPLHFYKGKLQTGMIMGVLAPEGGHFDFKPEKGVTLLISNKGGHCLHTLCQASPASLIYPGAFSGRAPPLLAPLAQYCQAMLTASC